MKSINPYNLEEWIFDALEGNLNKDEMAQFNQYLESNPLVKEEYDDWKNTIIKEPELPYPKKNSLLKKDKSFFTLWKWTFMGYIVLFIFYLPIKPYNSLTASKGTENKIGKKGESTESQLRNVHIQTFEKTLPFGFIKKPTQPKQEKSYTKSKKEYKENDHQIIPNISHINAIVNQKSAEKTCETDTEHVATNHINESDNLSDDIMIANKNDLTKENKKTHAYEEEHKCPCPLKGNSECCRGYCVIPGSCIDKQNTTKETSNVINENSKKGTCKLNFRIGLNMGISSVKLNKGINGTDYINTLSSTMNTPIDFTLELIHKNLSLSTGIGFIQRNDAHLVTYSDTSIVHTNNLQIIPIPGYNADSNWVDTLYVDSIWSQHSDTNITSNMFTYHSYSQFATIPLLIGYHINKGKFEFAFKAGLLLNILTRTKGSYHIEDNYEIAYSEQKESPFMKCYSQINLGIDLMYHINNNLSLSFSPFYLFGVNNIYQVDKSINNVKIDLSKYTLGIKYKINRKKL